MGIFFYVESHIFSHKYNIIKNFKQFINESIDYNKIISLEIPYVVEECNNYLSQIDLEVEIDDKYEFDEDWVAVYVGGSVYSKIITIGINTELFVNICKKKHMDYYSAEKNIEVSIWHEVGHGLIEFFKDQMDITKESGEKQLIDLFKHHRWISLITDDKEEKMVEMFGEYMADVSVKEPKLLNLIDDYIELYKNQ